jgi:hypothetical protein
LTWKERQEYEMDMREAKMDDLLVGNAGRVETFVTQVQNDWAHRINDRLAAPPASAAAPSTAKGASPLAVHVTQVVARKDAPVQWHKPSFLWTPREAAEIAAAKDPSEVFWPDHLDWVAPEDRRRNDGRSMTASDDARYDMPSAYRPRASFFSSPVCLLTSCPGPTVAALGAKAAPGRTGGVAGKAGEASIVAEVERAQESVPSTGGGGFSLPCTGPTASDTVSDDAATSLACTAASMMPTTTSVVDAAAALAIPSGGGASTTATALSSTSTSGSGSGSGSTTKAATSRREEMEKERHRRRRAKMRELKKQQRQGGRALLYELVVSKVERENEVKTGPDLDPKAGNG